MNDTTKSVAGGKMPASLLKVEEMTGKTISFYEADLTELDGIRVPFKKVRMNLHGLAKWS